METNPQDILKQIVNQFGKQIFNKSESDKLEGLLADYMTHDRKKLKFFRQAVKENIAHELLQSDVLDQTEKTIKLNMLKTKFQSETQMIESTAYEIVDCFAYALGWKVSVKKERISPQPAKQEDKPSL